MNYSGYTPCSSWYAASEADPQMITRRSVFVLLALILSGCVTVGSSFQWSQARQIKKGMNQAQVEAIMGKPTTVVSQSGIERWAWSYGTSDMMAIHSTGASFSIDFKDGRVVTVPTIPASFQ